MYQVLYRKWRPAVFEDVVGQPQVTVTLRNELKAGRISTLTCLPDRGERAKRLAPKFCKGGQLLASPGWRPGVGNARFAGE